MAETYPLGLALADYIPNLAFIAGAYFLVRFATLIRGKNCAQLMAIGTGLIFLGGLFKASWKLLVVLQVANVRFFDNSLFIFQAPGFSLVMVAMILIARSKGIEGEKCSVIAIWKVPLLLVITITSLVTYGLLISLAFRKGIKIAVCLFLITIIVSLGMSGMASWSEQSVGRQWIEEGINIIGQISFAMGCWLTYRKYDLGLKPEANQ